MLWSTSLCKKTKAINFSFMTNFLIKIIFKIHFLSKNAKDFFPLISRSDVKDTKLFFIFRCLF